MWSARESFSAAVVLHGAEHNSALARWLQSPVLPPKTSTLPSFSKTAEAGADSWPGAKPSHPWKDVAVGNVSLRVRVPSPAERFLKGLSAGSHRRNIDLWTHIAHTIALGRKGIAPVSIPLLGSAA